MFRFSKVLRRSAAPIMARRFSEDVSTKAVTQKGPITFASLGLALITGLVIVTYYKYEKEERIQNSSQKAVTYGKIGNDNVDCLLTLSVYVNREGSCRWSLGFG